MSNIIELNQPSVLETLWWPDHAIAAEFGPQNEPNEWIGIFDRYRIMQPGQCMKFYVERIVGHFDLTVYEDGSHRLDPDVVPHHPNCCYIAEDGYIGEDTDDLIGMAVNEVERNPWLAPIQLSCRICSQRRIVPLYLSAHGTFEQEQLVA